ncbi:hypothetical protein ACLBTR_26265, partial [Pseudomonas aeruginosa]
MSIVRLSKVAATFACGLLALCLALQLWQAYVLAPWTRDGRVSAQVIRIAPEVSGSVEAVFVADNQRRAWAGAFRPSSTWRGSSCGV